MYSLPSLDASSGLLATQRFFAIEALLERLLRRVRADKAEGAVGGAQEEAA